MRSQLAVFNSDRLNRHNLMCSASELMSAEQRQKIEASKYQIRPGLPLLVQHDVHRIAGWASSLGIYIDGSMVRSLGLIEEPETESEKERLENLNDKFWKIYHQGDAENFRQEIIERIYPETGGELAFCRTEALTLVEDGLASRLYPHLFVADGEFTDKDGLVDYRFLAKEFTETQPGVFHDHRRDLLLFAHPFFRRRLSRKNSLNQYFLSFFSHISSISSELVMRIRIDPDAVGHPSTSFHRMELEYWRGPLFDNDIGNIPSGVAEHKADGSTRHYEGVDFTQIWWKALEDRGLGGAAKIPYRTFEVEEITNIPAAGVSEKLFGCRYSHAEYSIQKGLIMHFDGAIRAYDDEAYMSRIEVAIDRAGKQSVYTKLFRIDGPLEISTWKTALDKYFKGNPLIAEYFGSDVDVCKHDVSDETDQMKSVDPNIAMLIAVHSGCIKSKMDLDAPTYYQIGNLNVKIFEIGCGKIADYLRSRFDFQDVPTCWIKDKKINIPSIIFGKIYIESGKYASEIILLIEAIKNDFETGLIEHVAASFTWQFQELVVDVSVAGESQAICEFLLFFAQSVNIKNSPSDWIQTIADKISAIDPNCSSEVNWSRVRSGFISIPRAETVEQQLPLPRDLIEELKERGALK